LNKATKKYLLALPWILQPLLVFTDLFFGRGAGWADLGALPDWFYTFRLPRVLVAIFAGASLAIAGLALQSLFRNPLAGPFLTGITPGASFAIAILLMSFPEGIRNPFLQSIGLTGAGMLGGILVLLLQLYINRKRNGIFTLLLSGVMLGYLLSAGTEILQTLADAGQIRSFVMWGLGNFDRVQNSQVLWFIPLSVVGIFWIFLLRFRLDAWMPGDLYAQNSGVNTSALRFQVIVAAGLLAGATTALCGPIGFVGLAAPHLARILHQSGNHTRILFPTIIWGAVLCVMADLIAHNLFSHLTLNINAICAIIGAPVVLWVLLKNRLSA
jgi:iron complex transport system permease protein